MMDMSAVLQAMRDPAGVPAHPQLFQVLMVATWVLHIAFVHLTLGAAGLSIYSFFRHGQDPHWLRLSIAMTKVTKVGVSLLIVLGVAPLLFTQVIYDPQWYAASVLSGRWLIVFIFTLIIGYCAWFVFYYGNKPGGRRWIGLFALLGLSLFLLDGLIMHTLAYQSLLPDQWLSWYAPNGVIDARGASLHAIQWPRFAFMIALSIPAVGMFLCLYADYLRVRPDVPTDYLAWARVLGLKVARVGIAISLCCLLAWQWVLPTENGLQTHVLGWSLVAMLLTLTIWLFRARTVSGHLLMTINLAYLCVLAIWREVIRINTMAPFGYDVSNYPVHTDWPSLLLFFLTLAGVGGLVGGFFLSVLYQAGRTEGVYTASPWVARLASAAVWVLTIWIVVFFSYGIVVWLGHAFSRY